MLKESLAVCIEYAGIDEVTASIKVSLPVTEGPYFTVK